MKNNESITQQRLKEVLKYYRTTGLFLRKTSVSQHKAGSVAGNINGNGYVYITIDGNRYLAHRLAWLWVHGVMPSNHLDHRDGDPTNNRIKNLRVGSQAENLQNTCMKSNNTSGHKGVSWHKGAGKWMVQIMVNGHYFYLGLFTDFDKACEKYDTAKAKLHTFCSVSANRESSKTIGLKSRESRRAA